MELKNPPSVAAGRVRSIQGVVTVRGGGNQGPVTWPGGNLFFRSVAIEISRCCPPHSGGDRKDPSNMRRMCQMRQRFMAVSVLRFFPDRSRNSTLKSAFMLHAQKPPMVARCS